MDELPDTAETCMLRKEQERERRRLRDRERRQSMSLEERERHLARRRRNYQLRRQKAENTQFDSPFPTVAAGEVVAVNHVAAARVESDQEQETLNTGYKNYESLNIPHHKLAKQSGRLRLNRLKHLARTLNESCIEHGGDTNRVAADLLTKIKEIPDGALSNGVRLNQIKRLARSLSSAKESDGSELCHSKVEE